LLIKTRISFLLYVFFVACTLENLWCGGVVFFLPYMFLRLSRVREYTHVRAATEYTRVRAATDLFQSDSTNILCAVF
jgi:hypothetical protein